MLRDPQMCLGECYVPRDGGIASDSEKRGYVPVWVNLCQGRPTVGISTKEEKEKG
jgi:hypothetical protein